jgi:CTP:molybdopterin cytidylyltransferase MocA
MGSCKQLLDLGGKTLLARCLETILAGGISEIVVVVGTEGELVAAEAGRFPIRIAANHDPAGDMASSVRTGRDALPSAASGVIIALCDFPLLQPSTVATLREVHETEPGRIIIPTHAGQRGHPILFPRTILEELREGLTLRDLIRRDPDRLCCIEVNDPGILFDMDTPEDYQRLSRLLSDPDWKAANQRATTKSSISTRSCTRCIPSFSNSFPEP